MAFSSIDAVLNAMTRAESAGSGAVNPALYALRYRGAAIKLHELLSIDSNRPIWWEVNPTTGRPLPRDAVHGDGLDVLLQVVEFQNWRMAMEEEHRQLCIKSSKPLEAVPMQPSQPAPEGAYSTRKFEIGFDRQEAIDLLSRHGVRHGLGATSEDAAFEPLSQAHLIAARMANDRWNFTKETDAASEVHRLGLADQYPPGMPAWMVMQLHAGRENESAINAGLDAGRLPLYEKNAMGFYVPSTHREGAYLKRAEVLDFIRAGGLKAIEEAAAAPDEVPRHAPSQMGAVPAPLVADSGLSTSIRSGCFQALAEAAALPEQRANGSSPFVNPSDPLQEFRDIDGLSFSEVSISFVGDRFDEGDRVGANSQMDVSARGRTRRVPLALLGLIDGRSGELNESGKVLLRCALGSKQENSEASRKAISRTRKLLKEKFGIGADPFQRYHAKTGWAPVFKVTERRGLADERARREAERSTVSLDRLREVGWEPGTRLDDDEGGRWLRENDPRHGV